MRVRGAVVAAAAEPGGAARSPTPPWPRCGARRAGAFTVAASWRGEALCDVGDTTTFTEVDTISKSEDGLEEGWR